MGGKKTAGAIHNEATRFVGKHYGVMLAITMILLAVSLVLGTISSIITMPISVISSVLTPMFHIDSRMIERPQDIWNAISPILAVSGVFGLATMMIGISVSILKGATNIGAYDATITLLGGSKPTFDSVWRNFWRHWLRYIGVIAWMTLWILLWSLLFLIPGYIKSLSYRFAPYLVLQYPDMSVRDALKKSMAMTNGYKGRIFGLDMIMLGYGIAATICCLLWLGFLLWLPLLSLAMYTICYLDIKQAAVDNGLLAGT